MVRDSSVVVFRCSVSFSVGKARVISFGSGMYSSRWSTKYEWRINTCVSVKKLAVVGSVFIVQKKY